DPICPENADYVNPLSFPKPPSRLEPIPAPRVSVVIVNYNSWSDVCRLVAILAVSPEVSAGRAEIIVVANASAGPIPEDFRVPTPGVRLVLRDENGGFAAGVNAGWHTALGRWLLVLNPDVVVEQDWLAHVVARVRELDAGPGLAPGIVGFG